MHEAFNRLKTLRLKIEQFYPKKVPITVKELDDFTTKVLLTSGIQDLPEYRRVIATAVMHLGPVTHRKSARFFSRSLRRALCNQAAFDKIQSLVAEQKAKEEAQKADGPAEEAT